MAPPSSLPRLTDLDIRQIERQIVEAMASHLEFCSKELAPWKVRIESAKTCHLAQKLHALHAWALRAEGQAETMHQAAIDVFDALYSRAWANSGKDLDRLKPTDALSTLLVAARARGLIANGKSIGSLELATLASVSERHVRLLIQRRKIKTKQRLISAADAQAWLAARANPVL